MEMRCIGQLLLTDSEGPARHESCWVAIGYWHDEGTLPLSAKHDVVSPLIFKKQEQVYRNKLIILSSTNLASCIVAQNAQH